jgi:hypothetical protein
VELADDGQQLQIEIRHHRAPLSGESAVRERGGCRFQHVPASKNACKKESRLVLYFPGGMESNTFKGAPGI